MDMFNSALMCVLQKYSSIEMDKIIIATAHNAKTIPEKSITENTDAVISVRTPHYEQDCAYQDITARLENNDAIQYAIYQRNDRERIYRIPHTGFITGDIYSLSDAITALKDTNNTMRDSIQAIRASAEHMRTKHQRHIIKKMGQRTWSGATQSASLILFSGILMQQHLSACREDIPPLGTVADAESLLNTWNYLINLNQFDAFKPTVEILNILMTESITSANNTLQPLIDVILNTKNTIKSIINAGMTLLPYISEDRSTAAEYYTRESIAEMLAHLTIVKGDMHSTDYFKEHKIADFTCGTGALLRAGYRRIQSLHKRHHRLYGMEDLRRGAIEGGLIGTDISPVAVHLAIISLLVADNSGEWHNPTGIACVKVGGPSGMTGAIEYIREQGYFASQENVDIPRIPDKSIDYILMNPPYSRSRNNKAVFDIADLGEAERHACQARWKDLIHNYPAKKIAGMAPTFIIVASKKIKDWGRIGFVLPITAAFAEAWSETREFIHYNYTDIMVITFSSGKSLSHSTNLTEMLLVATKTPQPKKTPSEIYCVTLNRSPANPAEAVEMTRAILNSNTAASRLGCTVELGDVIGSIYNYVTDPGRPWSPLGAIDSHMVIFAEELVRGNFLKPDRTLVQFAINMVPIKDIFRVGPTHHIIGHTAGNFPSGAYELHRIDQIDAIKDGTQYSLWNVSKNQDKLIISPTHYGIPTGKSHNITRHNTTLFYNRRLGWSGNALLGASTKDRVMGGNGWVGLEHTDARVLKAAALWFNSTLGLVTHWTQASRSEPGRATAQIKAIKNIPCPQFDTLKDAVLSKAAKFFDDISSSELLSACYAHMDKNRHAIDEFVLEMLGICDVDIQDIRVRFCQEPTIHNYAKKPLKSLSK
ncbi:MAG: SAM-dependent DNA methyltransferase [Cenarchaeum sp. SB0673_bin_9]|nr:SAM-dependent DNA methyltransferase [Cenarchaeum sp. SB0673_bin_9]